MKRPVTTCSCGRRTWSVSGVCRACAEDLSVVDGDSPNVLDEHGWVNDGLIRRYVS